MKRTPKATSGMKQNLTHAMNGLHPGQEKKNETSACASHLKGDAFDQ
jgi:hypothetical protein